ncbi:hypothetical protein GINT2_002131 [Glugoides intestinalis]
MNEKGISEIANSGEEQKEQRKLAKAQKKAEKLAKLMAKKEVVQPAPPKKSKIPISAGYDPSEVEKHWTEYWKVNKTFLPAENEKKFVMCVPPPNITGSLHIGHAMMIAIEDCIVRYKRINGYEVLYLPGLDHAGIATQNVVMKSLGRIVDRETFMKAAFEWSDKYKDRICEQFDRVGASLDYSRKVFTLDEKVSKSVSIAFCQLYKKGLIYRDNKIVNWCGKLKTTLSDLEVNYKDVDGGSIIEVDGGKYKVGVLYYIKYYLTKKKTVDIKELSGSPYVIIATTRPETILGDSAICINPDDSRFRDVESIFREGAVPDVLNEKYRKEASDEKQGPTGGNAENEEMKAEKKNKYKVNKDIKEDTRLKSAEYFAVNPLTLEPLPVIFDSQADLSFGTGILKVTPCHDPVDFRLGKKHSLEFKKITNEENRITHEKYNGMMRFEARKAIVEDLEKMGFLIKVEDHPQILPFCSRSNDIIESVVKEQWWCDCKGMADKAMEAVKKGEIDIQPVEARNVWFRWLENIKDWCLSRQLWWGHRIPAYKTMKDGKEAWIVVETEEEAIRISKEEGSRFLGQDDDVLDTWFSSGLWPFSTLGWPENTPDFERYFPTTLLETGSDILFFWVARMAMLSYELTGKRPFDKVFLHGIVRDAHGRKMSKSVGNVIDPLYVIDGISLDEMIENLKNGNLDPREMRRAIDALKKDFPNGIPKCGADALRFTLLSYTNGMKDINLDILRVQGYSRLCNKLWNAYKFVSSAIGTIQSQLEGLTLSTRPHHKWILSRLNKTIEDQHRFIKSYNFMMATQSAYELFFDFCDSIIEVSKNPSPKDVEILRFVFLCILKLFHPFMPFITEELHFKLTSTTITDYPVLIKGDLENNFEDLLGLAKICRSKEKVQVEDFDDIEYLKKLVKGTFEVVGKLSSYEMIGELKYRVLE